MKCSVFILWSCRGTSVAIFPSGCLKKPPGLINGTRRGRTRGPVLVAGGPEAWHEDRSEAASHLKEPKSQTL